MTQVTFAMSAVVDKLIWTTVRDYEKSIPTIRSSTSRTSSPACVKHPAQSRPLVQST